MKYVKKSWILMLSIPLAIWGFVASQEKDHAVLSDLEINSLFAEQAHAAHWNSVSRTTNSSNSVMIGRGDDGGDGE